MVNVISDTSFLIHLATHRIKNIDSIETEIGTLSFIVPKIVKKELIQLIKPMDTILVKGSRYMKMELIINFLIDQFKIKASE